MYILSGPNTEPYAIITGDGEIVINDEVRAARHAPELLEMARRQNEYKALLAEIGAELRGKAALDSAESARLGKIERLTRGVRDAGSGDDNR